jgi:hypothetical protein
MRDEQIHTIDTFQLWVNDRRRFAETAEAYNGWACMDAWIDQRVTLLKARYPYRNISSMPLFLLVED